MKILLTGYAGLFGRSLARALKRDGHTLRVVLHKRTVPRREFQEEADELLWGSLEEDGILERALSGVDAVIHSAWTFSKQTDSRPTGNETVTRALFELCRERGIKKFAFISSVAVYGMESAKGQEFSEDSPLASDEQQEFIYPSEKIAVERALQQAAPGDMLLGVFRPGRLFEDSGGPVKGRIPLGRRTVGIGIGTGRNRLPFIHVDDAAEAVARWVTTGSENVVVNLTPNRCLSYRQWYRAWGAVRDLRLSPFFIRPWVLRMAVAGGTALLRIMGKSKKIDIKYALAASTRDISYRNDRARALLDWNPSLTDAYIKKVQ